MTAKRLELLVKFCTVTVEYDKRLEKLSVVRGAGDRIEDMIWSIVSQSVEAVDVFFSNVGTQLSDRLCIRLQAAYAGGELVYFHTLTHMFGVAEISVEVQWPGPPGEVSCDAVAANPSTPVSPRPWKSHRKELRDRSKEVDR